MTFGCCFLISKHHENCNGMASFIVIRHLPLQHGTLLFSVQLNVFISSAWCLIIVYYLLWKTTDRVLFGWLKKDRQPKEYCLHIKFFYLSTASRITLSFVVNIKIALRDLVPFAQFKKREKKHHGGLLLLVK